MIVLDLSHWAGGGASPCIPRFVEPRGRYAAPPSASDPRRASTTRASRPPAPPPQPPRGGQRRERRDLFARERLALEPARLESEHLVALGPVHEHLGQPQRIAVGDGDGRGAVEGRLERREGGALHRTTQERVLRDPVLVAAGPLAAQPLAQVVHGLDVEAAVVGHEHARGAGELLPQLRDLLLLLRARQHLRLLRPRPSPPRPGRCGWPDPSWWRG